MLCFKEREKQWKLGRPTKLHSKMIQAYLTQNHRQINQITKQANDIQPSDSIQNFGKIMNHQIVTFICMYTTQKSDFMLFSKKNGQKRGSYAYFCLPKRVGIKGNSIAGNFRIASTYLRLKPEATMTNRYYLRGTAFFSFIPVPLQREG